MASEMVVSLSEEGAAGTLGSSASGQWIGQDRIYSLESSDRVWVLPWKGVVKLHLFNWETGNETLGGN